MRRSILSKILAIAMIFTCTISYAEAGFPSKFLGLWTDTAMTCDWYKNHPKILTKDNFWIKINKNDITGSNKVNFLKNIDKNTVQASDDSNNNITVEYTLRKDDILDERVTGARGSMLYMRCR